MDIGQRMVDTFYSQKYIQNSNGRHERRTSQLFDDLGILQLKSEVFRCIFFESGSIRTKQNYIRKIHDDVNIRPLIDKRIKSLEVGSKTKNKLHILDVLKQLKDYLKTTDYFYVKHPLGKSGYPDFLLYHDNRFLLWECKSNKGTNFLTGDHMPQPTDFDIYEFTSKAANRTVLMAGEHIIDKQTHKVLLNIRSQLEEQLHTLQNTTDTTNWLMQMRCAPYTSVNMISSHDEHDWKSDMEKILINFWSTKIPND